MESIDLIEEPQWIDRGSYWINDAPQGSDAWKKLSIGGINASSISYIVGRSPPQFTDPPEVQAEIICGLQVKQFSEEALFRMKRGNLAEPIIREWDSKRRGVKIREVGKAFLKSNPIFRASMDGEEIENDTDFVEYKTTVRLARSLRDYLDAVSHGHTPQGYNHLFASHYDQMDMTGVVCNKKWVHYSVFDMEGQVFYQCIPIDYNHWSEVLYPRAMDFYNKYVEPLMLKHNIQRIDPPQS